MANAMLRGVRAVGLDLGHTLMRYDGVPMNWQAHYPDALDCVFRRLGVRVGDDLMRDCCARLARYNTRLYPREAETDAGTIFRDVLAPCGRALPGDVDAAIDAFFGYFRQSYTVFDDVLPFLKQLRESGIRCGILTDVPYGMPERWVELDTAPFREWVDCVLSSVDVGYRKPHAAGFQALARRLGCEAPQMAYIGDEGKDVVGAKAAGMRAVWIDRAGTDEAFGEDLKINSLSELRF